MASTHLYRVEDHGGYLDLYYRGRLAYRVDHPVARRVARANLRFGVDKCADYIITYGYEV